MKRRSSIRDRLDDGKARVTGHQPTKPVKLAQSRLFRRYETTTEKQTWRLIRNRGILNLKFRRQQVIDGFIVDFYCPAQRSHLSWTDLSMIGKSRRNMTVNVQLTWNEEGLESSD